jgi:hypothetical protein
MAHVAQFISVLFNSREQAHIFHLQTSSYAKHKALNSYYDGIVDFADDYVEAYQGKYGILKGYTPQESFFEGDNNVLTYFDHLETFVADALSKLPDDADLQNIAADILHLVHSTQYKLKHLS